MFAFHRTSDGAYSALAVSQARAANMPAVVDIALLPASGSNVECTYGAKLRERARSPMYFTFADHAPGFLAVSAGNFTVLSRSCADAPQSRRSDWCKNPLYMADVAVLVVRSWLCDLAPIRAALASAGLEISITRVDFEAALYAAVSRTRFDIVIHDPATTTLSRDAVAECLHAHRLRAPLLELGDIHTLGERVTAALRARRS